MRTLSIFLLILPFCSFSQALALDWILQIGDEKSEVFFAIEEVEEGRLLIIGQEAKPVGVSPTADVLVTKITIQGEILWQHSYGGLSNDNIVDVQVDKEGNYLFYGSTGSNIDGVNEGNYDIWLLKTTPEGEFLWQRRFGGTSYDRISGLEITATNDLIFATFPSRVDGDFLNVTGEGCVFVMKLSSNGELIWSKRYLQGAYARGRLKSSDLDGHYYIYGLILGTNSERCTEDGFVLHINEEGEALSSFMLAGSGSDEVNDVYFLSENELLLQMHSNSNDWGETKGNSDIIILRTSRNGEVFSSNIIGTSGQDRVNYILPTSDNIFIAGTLNHKYHVGGCPNESFTGNGQLFFARLGYNGEQEVFSTVTADNPYQVQFLINAIPSPWDSHFLAMRSFFSRNSEHAVKIFDIANDGSYINTVISLPAKSTGIKNDFIKVGECNFLLGFSTQYKDGLFDGNRGSTDIWILNYNACLDDEIGEEELLEVYPNPVLAGQSIQLVFSTIESTLGDVEWVLYDVAGRLIDQKKINGINNRYYSILLPGHLSGMHILKVKYGEMTKQFKIIVL